MNRQEFIEGLRRSLSSINDYTFVNDTIAYYENYIESRIRMGRTEEEVMRELGDPRLIAKSIRATHVQENGEDRDEYSRFEENPYNRNQPSGQATFHFNGRQIAMPSWLIKVIGIVILLVVFYVVVTVLRWLSPFIMVGLFAYLIYKIFIGKY